MCYTHQKSDYDTKSCLHWCLSQKLKKTNSFLEIEKAAVVVLIFQFSWQEKMLPSEKRADILSKAPNSYSKEEVALFLHCPCLQTANTSSKLMALSHHQPSSKHAEHITNMMTFQKEIASPGSWGIYVQISSSLINLYNMYICNTS